MTDRELERQLRDYFRAEGGDEHASRDLLARVSAIPDAPPVMSPPSHGAWLLAAAVLLLIALLAAAIAAGTGLRLRNPLLEGVVATPTSATTERLAASPAGSTSPYAFSPRDFATAVSIEGCTPFATLPEHVVADLRTSLPVAGHNLGSLTWVFEDGLVLIAPAGAGPDQPWSQRRLTPQGFSHVMAAAMPPELPSCRTYELGASMTDQFTLAVQGASGVYSFSLGSTDPLSPAVTTAAQATAIDNLLADLQDPDLGMGPSGWVDSWSQYTSDTWQVQVDLQQGAGPPLTDQVSLPDGTPLLQVGAEDPTAAQRGVESGARCAIIDHETASALLAQLPGPGNPPGSWDFSNATVTVAPVLAGAACPTAPEAAPSPPGQPSTMAPSGTEGCAFLSPEEVQAALHDPKLATSARADTSFQGWAACLYGSDYTSGNGLLDADARQGFVLVRRQPVSADQATDVAARLYGGGAVTTLDVAGHQVFYNGCQPGTDPYGCTPSLAISAEPDFVVLVWTNASRDDLLTLATALISRTDGGPSP